MAAGDYCFQVGGVPPRPSLGPLVCQLGWGQGAGQEAVWQSWERAHSRGTAVRVGIEQGVRRMWGLVGPVAKCGQRGDMSVCGSGGLDDEE